MTKPGGDQQECLAILRTSSRPGNRRGGSAVISLPLHRLRFHARPGVVKPSATAGRSRRPAEPLVTTY
nr:hypothetical protein [uncultured Desulfuromonas sp.]